MMKIEEKEADGDLQELDWAELQERIKSRYPSMSKRLQEVAAYVLQNPQMVAFETIAVLAEEIKVPPSTLIRFATTLDLSGFNELKSVIKADIMDHTVDYNNRIEVLRSHDSWNKDDLLPRFAKANRDALRHLEQNTPKDYIDRAVAMMSKARQIFLLGNGRAYTVSTYLHYALNHIDNKKVFIITGTGGRYREEVSNMDRGDLLIAVSYSPYSSNTCELAAQAANRGISVLSITDSPLSPLATTSQLSFVVHEARVDTFRSISASMVLSQVLVIALADFSAQADKPVTPDSDH